ncbi:MAG: hypothetical protein JW940_22205 [Polyangiaceae bacterium]|nr:hypothetical protein [Polyangiaceae bacterium]
MDSVAVKHTIAAALALGCLALGRPARAADPDPWWGKDKALHFSLSIGLGSGGYAGSALWAPERWQRAVAGAGFSLTLGAGKELFDLAGYGEPSWRDFTWDLAGTAVGVGVAYLLDVALFSHASRQADPDKPSCQLPEVHIAPRCGRASRGMGPTARAPDRWRQAGMPPAFAGAGRAGRCAPDNGSDHVARCRIGTGVDTWAPTSCCCCRLC